MIWFGRLRRDGQPDPWEAEVELVTDTRVRFRSVGCDWVRDDIGAALEAGARRLDGRRV